MIENFEALKKNYFKVQDSIALRRLSYFPDKENKIRIIGILD
jgi:hypothetical protein